MSIDSFLNVPMSWKDLKAKLDASVPQRAERWWELAATLEASDGVFVVIDPCYYVPDYVDPDHIYDITLEGPVGPAAVFLEWLRISEKDRRVATIRVVFSDELETSRAQVGKVGVDSATLAIAAASQLPKRWKVGGELSRSSVWIDFMDKQIRAWEGKRAAELLSENGFKMKHDHDWNHKFVEPLSDQEIRRANDILRVAGMRASVNTFVHHSTTIIRQQITDSHIAILDGKSCPYLVAFMSGWGDGTYEWFALRSGEKVVGFISELIAPYSK